MFQQAAVLGICIEPGKVISILKVASIVFLIPLSEVLWGRKAVYTMQEKSVFPMESGIHYKRYFGGNTTSSSYENLPICGVYINSWVTHTLKFLGLNYYFSPWNHLKF